jgi:hypothetical protein
VKIDGIKGGAYYRTSCFGPDLQFDRGITHDCMDAGGRATSGTVAEPGTTPWKEEVASSLEQRPSASALGRAVTVHPVGERSTLNAMYTTAWMQEVEQRQEQLPRRYMPGSLGESWIDEHSDRLRVKQGRCYI